MRTVPIIATHNSEIRDFIESVPERCAGYEILSEIRRNEYLSELEARLGQFLIPEYERCRELYQVPALDIDMLDRDDEMEGQER